jgi:hypothetical protein
MVYIGRIWSKVVKNGKKLPEMPKKCPEMPQNGQKWPSEIQKITQYNAKHI